jgi:hypothetical protein
VSAHCVFSHSVSLADFSVEKYQFWKYQIGSKIWIPDNAVEGQAAVMKPLTKKMLPSQTHRERLLYLREDCIVNLLQAGGCQLRPPHCEPIDAVLLISISMQPLSKHTPPCTR